MLHRKSTENGRSMVEMLAVLAIIGVISVGAIAAYIIGINEYRAINILDDAKKRAILASVQLERNYTKEPSLNEFNVVGYNGIIFGERVLKADGTAWVPGESQFAIEIISKIDKDVCKQIHKVVGTTGIVRAIYSGETKLTTDSDCPSEASPMRLVYNNYLARGETTVAETHSKCPGGVEPNADGTCADNACTDNSNCKKENTYCKVPVVNNIGNCSVGSGTCESVGTPSSSNGFIFTVSDLMTWDAAQNWCAAVSKKLNKNLSLASKETIENLPLSLYITLNNTAGVFWLKESGTIPCHVYSIVSSSLAVPGPRDTQLRNDTSYPLCH